MKKIKQKLELSAKDLRWKPEISKLPFESTKDLPQLTEIIGQKRGVEAFEFGIKMSSPGYNIFVTGRPGSGRLDVVKKLLEDISREEKAPDDFCYVNNFKDPGSPKLLRFKAGKGSEFQKDINEFIEYLKREVPRFFDSQEYIKRKNEIMEAYDKKTKEFFQNLDKKVKEKGFALVMVQAGEFQKPEIMPIVDGEPTPMHKLEELVAKKRFPKEEFEELKRKYKELKEEIDNIFFEIKEMQRELQEKGKEADRFMFTNLAKQAMSDLFIKYTDEPLKKYLETMLNNLGENLEIFRPKPQVPGMIPLLMGDPFLPYQVNLLIDNSEQKSPPVVIESYPNYRNLFGSIERVVDTRGVWRSDFTKIKAGSFLKANGGYLVLQLIDILIEPGVWPALKRALKSNKMEIQTFDPFYWFTSVGLKPEPIDINVKVVIIADSYLYQLLQYYDEDVPKIFKVRADFDYSMNKSEENILRFASFIKKVTEDEDLLPFDKSGVGAILEHAVRITGRKEKISVSFPVIANIIREAHYWAGKEGLGQISESHVEKAIDAQIFRSNMIEEKLQEMIDRGSIMIETEGAEIGQVNGISVISLGDYTFGRPSRITATTAMGSEGVVNIEREADLAGPIHNKGVLILTGFLKRRYAQDKPLSISASLAFEQSYSGVEGDSASSTEVYALLSSLSEIPIKQGIAVTGSVNQNGEVQSIGGVNEKIEGFYECCIHKGLTGEQGVIIPESNVQDLMLKKEVVKAVNDRKFHVWSVKTIDEGMEILTGVEAGERQEDGTFPEGSINFLVNQKLAYMAEELQKFAKEKEGKKEKKKTKKFRKI